MSGAVVVGCNLERGCDVRVNQSLHRNPANWLRPLLYMGFEHEERLVMPTALDEEETSKSSLCE